MRSSFLCSAGGAEAPPSLTACAAAARIPPLEPCRLTPCGKSRKAFQEESSKLPFAQKLVNRSFAVIIPQNTQAFNRGILKDARRISMTVQNGRTPFSYDCPSLTPPPARYIILSERFSLGRALCRISSALFVTASLYKKKPSTNVKTAIAMIKQRAAMSICSCRKPKRESATAMTKP